MSVDTSTTPPSLKVYSLKHFGIFDAATWEAVRTTVKSRRGKGGVASVELSDRGFMKVTPNLDGIKPDRVAANLEILDEWIEGVISRKARAPQVQTSVGRGVGGGGYI